MHKYCNDKPKEACGVFGIWNIKAKPVAQSIYYGLCALQHRGQESAGIAVCNTNGIFGNISCHKDMGLVSEVFSPENLKELEGNLGIGHVRYSTTGESSAKNAQPLALSYSKGTLAIVHNGNITNCDELKKDLEEDGAIFHTTTDSEIIAFMIAKNRIHSRNIEEAVLQTAQKLKGGYALLVMSPRKLIGIRDPLGLKPLCLGRSEDSYILASESCALSSVNATFVRDIKPGEMVTITENGVSFDETYTKSAHAHCIFEYIYFARLDSIMDGIPIYDARINAGMALYQAKPTDADIVVGVPDSGLAAAIGYSMASSIPFTMAFHKNSYVGRTFIKPTQKERESAVHIKLNVIKSVVDGKRIVLIDDSIVRGTTIASLISMLKEAGALSVDVRISSPPFLYPCYYGTDVPSNEQLIASKLSKEDICKQIGASSLEYLAIEDFKKMVGDLPLCSACFDQKYPL